MQKFVNNNSFKNNHIIILSNVLQVIGFQTRAYIKIPIKNHARPYYRRNAVVGLLKLSVTADCSLKEFAKYHSNMIMKTSCASRCWKSSFIQVFRVLYKVKMAVSSKTLYEIDEEY